MACSFCSQVALDIFGHGYPNPVATLVGCDLGINTALVSLAAGGPAHHLERDPL
jgi:hypothetical protein